MEICNSVSHKLYLLSRIRKYMIHIKGELQNECKISTLAQKRDMHFSLFMHKQSKNDALLKPYIIATR